MEQKFIKDVDPSRLNFEIIDNPRLSLNDCSKAINAVPFLAKRRLVVFKNLLQTVKSKETLKGLSELIKANVAKVDQDVTNIIIFYEANQKLGRSGLAKILKKIDMCYEFEPLQGFALNKWIRNEVRNNNGRIDEEAIKELASLLGNDLWVISSEIKKLIAYADDERILKSMVNNLVQGIFDDSIFSLVDAIGQRNKQKSLMLLNQQLTSGHHEMYILSMLVRQFRIILGVKEMAMQQKTKKEISLFLGVHPFVVQKSISQARNYSFEQLHNIYHMLLGIDVKFKRGVLKEKGPILLELLMSKI